LIILAGDLTFLEKSTKNLIGPFIKAKKEHVEQAITNLPNLIKDFQVNINQDRNPIKQLATKLYQRYPYYIVSEFSIIEFYKNI